jgi:peptide/nickel transport system substrate-binding protein
MLRSCRPLLALTALACAVSACGSATTAGPQEGAGGVSLVIGAGAAPENLNPVLGFAPNGASKIFDGLLDHAADLSLRPALAADLPQVSADGLTWTVDLRPGVRFHDGSPLTADDVVFTYEAVVDPDVASPIASDLDAMRSVRAVDDDTVEFRLRYPYQPFGQRLTIGVVPAALLEGEDLDATAFNSAPVGTGPYRVVEYRSGERMVLRANEEYFRGAPRVTDVTVVFTPDDNTRAQRMAAGDYDVTVLPPRLAATYEGRAGHRVLANPSADYRGIGLPDTELTGDPLVRRAVNLALDRQAMIDTVLDGRGTPAATPVSPHLPDHDPSASFRHDPQQAAALLDQAGWTAGPDGRRSKDGRPAQLTILYPGSDVLRKELALAAASDLTEVGIQALAESATFDQMLARSGTDAALWGGGDPYDVDTAAYSLLHSRFVEEDGFVNMTGYRNPTVDAALDRGRTSADPAVRSAAYRDLQQAFVDDPGWAFLAFLDHTYVLRGAWTGLREQVEPHDHGLIHGPWWNLEEWAPAS